MDRLSPDDAAALALSHSDPDNARFQGWQSPLGIEAAGRFIEANESLDAFAPDAGVQLAIRHDVAGPLVGDFYVHRTSSEPDVLTVGLTLLPAMQGRGYARAALDAVVGAIEGSPDAGISTIVAIVDVDNAPSLRLFRRAGFTESERLHRTSVRRDGSIGDEIVFTRQVGPTS